MSHSDVMCEVEISDSSIVEVVDSEHFNDMGVSYDQYEVGGIGDDQYEEVTCETEDSQGLLMQSIDDGNFSHTIHIQNITEINAKIFISIKTINFPTKLSYILRLIYRKKS